MWFLLSDEEEHKLWNSSASQFAENCECSCMCLHTHMYEHTNYARKQIDRKFSLYEACPKTKIHDA
jgi:hypothetical protein